MTTPLIRVTPVGPAAIRVQPCGTAPACAYCRERVGEGVACSRCGAATCPACRGDYAALRACPTLGCPGDEPPRVTVVVRAEANPISDLGRNAYRAARALAIGFLATFAIVVVGFLVLVAVLAVVASPSALAQLGIVAASTVGGTLFLAGGSAALGNAFLRRP